MHQMAVNAHVPLLHMNGILIIDSTQVKSIPKEGARMTRKIIQTGHRTHRRCSEHPFRQIWSDSPDSGAGNFVTTQALKVAMSNI